MFGIILTGDKHLARKFDRLAYGSVKKIIAPAITKGLAVIRKAARDRVQVKSGRLKKSLGSKVKIYGGDNVFILVSEDAGANWGEPINVTNFTFPDEDCFNAGGEPHVCNRDTLKPWLDLSILFDENDYLHLAWGSYAWMYWGDDGSVGPWTYYFAGHIMHWGEDNNEFNIVDGCLKLGEVECVEVCLFALSELEKDVLDLC